MAKLLPSFFKLNPHKFDFDCFDRAPSGAVLFIAVSAIALVLLPATSRDARANDECGVGATVVCAPAGNPYASGITYNTNSGLDLSFGPGVVVDASGAAGIQINNGTSGNVVVNTTNGSVRSADRTGIDVNNNVGAITLTTGDVTSDGNYAIYTYAAGGPLAIDTTVGTVTGRWGGIYASTSDAAINIIAADVTSRGGTAIFATSYGTSSTIDINTTAGTVSTPDDYANGISAVSYVNNGPIRITTGDVSTTGMYSNAVMGAQMSAGSTSPLSIDTTAGTISTQGGYSIGVGAYARTRAEVVTGSITTAGLEAAGVHGYGQQAALSINTTAGTIQTQGASSAGILASNASGSTSITAGQITTSGQAAIGIAVTSENDGDGSPGSTDIAATGPITASGANSGGIIARDVGASGPINVTARANITAPGQNSVGIAAGSFGGPVTVTVDPGVTVMGGWSQNAGDLSTGASRSSTAADESSVFTYVGGGLPAAGVVLFSGAPGSDAVRLTNNGVIGAMNDRAVTMGFPCGGRGGSGGGLLLFNTTPTAPGGKSWLGTLASAIQNALIPSANAATPPVSRGCDQGNPDWGIAPDPANNLPATGSVTIDNVGTMTGYVTLWDGAAHTFNNSGTFDVRHFADTDGDGIRDTKAVSISDFGGPGSVFNNQAGGTVKFAPVPTAAATDATGSYVPTTGVDSRPLEASFYDLNRPGVVQGQFVNLQTFDNAGTIDLRGPQIGNTLVMTSNPAAGGAAGTGTFVSNGGQLLVNTRLNEGIAPGGASGSYSDMLIVDRTRMGGAPTAIGVTYDAAAAGALTTGNGIEIVEVRDKANSAAGVFVQGNRVAGGAYEYTLHHNGVGADAADGNWYLRSTRVPAEPGPGPAPVPAAPIEAPDYRVEVPTDMVAPALASRLGLTMLGTYDDRLGAVYADPVPQQQQQPQEIWCKDAAKNFRCRPSAQQNAYYAGTGVVDPYRWRLWGRFFGEVGSTSAGGHGTFGRLQAFASRGPSYDFRLGGLQIGADLYRDAANTAGLFISYGRAMSDVDAVYGGPAGRVTLDGYGFGGYWTHRRPGGWYTDAVVQGTYYGAIDARSVLGERLKTQGWGFMASLETGYPIALGAGWTVTPQAQALTQYLTLDGGADRFGRIDTGDTHAVFGRLGAKLNKDWATGDGRTLSTWVRLNYWHSFGATAKTTFSSLAGASPVTLGTRLGGNWMQVGLGASGQVTKSISIFASADYNVAVGHGRGHSIGGRLGLQVRW